MFDGMQQEWAPLNNPVFQLTPMSFHNQANYYYTSLGQPAISRGTFWDIYKLLLAHFQQGPVDASFSNDVQAIGGSNQVMEQGHPVGYMMNTSSGPLSTPGPSVHLPGNVLQHTLPPSMHPQSRGPQPAYSTYNGKVVVIKMQLIHDLVKAVDHIPVHIGAVALKKTLYNIIDKQLSTSKTGKKGTQTFKSSKAIIHFHVPNEIYDAMLKKRDTDEGPAEKNTAGRKPAGRKVTAARVKDIELSMAADFTAKGRDEPKVPHLHLNKKIMTLPKLRSCLP
ncbi:hypothetical protein L208DRAFT_1376235 [Tricholoma matsutake]|nr:hypothetical protein L208DRAFT_1376235 [Tricholoma matsutake 945]